MTSAVWVARVIEGYTLAGVIFAVAFVTRGVNTIDPAARGTGVWFRMLIVPGAALLWPWLAMRWLRS